MRTIGLRRASRQRAIPWCFRTGRPITTVNIDLPAGTSVGPISFGASYTLNGNALTLTGDVSFTAPGVFLTWNAPITLGASIHFGSVPNADFAGAIDVNGKTLTVDAYSSTLHALNGSGAIVFTGSNDGIVGSGNFSGTITGSFDFNGSLPNATVSGDNLIAVGTLGAVTVTANSIVVNGLMPGAPSHGIGTLQTGPLNLVGPLAVDLVPGGTSDQVKVTGSVTLSGPLSVYFASGSATAGQTFTIIDNDGSDTVSGTFTGLPEGATFTVGSTTFRVNYGGGDGNDVVLTVVSSAKTWTGAVSGNWSDAPARRRGDRRSDRSSAPEC